MRRVFLRNRAPARFPIALLPALLLAGPAAGCGGGDRPNVLLIVLDTARGDRFPWAGYDRPTAPRLEALAREAVVYTRAFSPAPWTVPAHASLFTGQYPSLHRTDCGSLRLPDAARTLAEILRDAGYRTAGYTANPWIGSGYGFNQGFDTYGETWREVRDGSADTGAALTNEKAIRFLHWWQETPEVRDRPFFLFINYFEPHLPYHPPEPERSALLRDRSDPARVERLARLGHPEEMRFIMGISDLTADDLEILGNLYDGEIAYADRKAGEVVAALRQMGVLDRTVVAVTGDHGENLGEHRMLDHKLSVHDTLLHVPLLLRYPPEVPAGGVVADPVQMHDLFPTVLALAGVPLPGGVTVEAVPLPMAGAGAPGRPPGTPIVGEFVGPPVEFLRILEGLFPGHDLSRFDRTLVALRQGDRKIHWGSDGRHALYDVVADPGETRDLAATEPDRLRELAGLVEEWLKRPARRSLTAPGAAGL
ncbi:MAG: sulfatase [Candidatus Polarisedimenticolia bacterium]